LQGFLGLWRREFVLCFHTFLPSMCFLRFWRQSFLVAASLFGCVVASRFVFGVAFGCVIASRFVLSGTSGCVVAILLVVVRAHQQAQQSPPSLAHCATTKRCTSTPCAAFVPHFATGAGELKRCVAARGFVQTLIKE
jgi:hypothetical protein